MKIRKAATIPFVDFQKYLPFIKQLAPIVLRKQELVLKKKLPASICSLISASVKEQKHIDIDPTKIVFNEKLVLDENSKPLKYINELEGFTILVSQSQWSTMPLTEHFSGGILYFHNLELTDGRVYGIQLGKGDIIIFPNNPFYDFTISRVTSGSLSLMKYKIG